MARASSRASSSFSWVKSQAIQMTSQIDIPKVNFETRKNNYKMGQCFTMSNFFIRRRALNEISQSLEFSISRVTRNIWKFLSEDIVTKELQMKDKSRVCTWRKFSKKGKKKQEKESSETMYKRLRQGKRSEKEIYKRKGHIYRF